MSLRLRSFPITSQCFTLQFARYIKFKGFPANFHCVHLIFIPLITRKKVLLASWIKLKCAHTHCPVRCSHILCLFFHSSSTVLSSTATSSLPYRCSQLFWTATAPFRLLKIPNYRAGECPCECVSLCLSLIVIHHLQVVTVWWQTTPQVKWRSKLLKDAPLFRIIVAKFSYAMTIDWLISVCFARCFLCLFPLSHPPLLPPKVVRARNWKQKVEKKTGAHLMS